MGNSGHWVRVEGFFGGVGGAFEVEFVSVGVREDGDPHAIADEGALGFEAIVDGVVIDGDRVFALEADGDAFAASAGGDCVGAILLQHMGCASEFEPAPAELAFVDPPFFHGEAEALDVEAERGFDVRDSEERDGLLYVWLGVFGGHSLLSAI